MNEQDRFIFGGIFLGHNEENLINEASTFITTCYHELNKTKEEIEERIAKIVDDIQVKGYYTHTLEELEHGSKMAWRNSNRCIGRLFWDRLRVIDARDLNSEHAIFEMLKSHIQTATNGGKIIPTITVFRQTMKELPTIRILNHQLIRYAGYEKKEGVIGDSASVDFTRFCQSLGWDGEGTAFDLLPLVVQIDNQPPKWVKLPKDLVQEVAIHHPRQDIFGEVPVKWYAVPVVSDMELEIGGIRYTAAPFNGWYMGTEIGARNLADESRYNLLPLVARQLGLNTDSNRSLWRDKALVELNEAVLHSFYESGVSIVDHHTAAQQFNVFERNECKVDREVTGRWSWLIPPVSPATTKIFHKRYNDKVVTPNFFRRDCAY